MQARKPEDPSGGEPLPDVCRFLVNHCRFSRTSTHFLALAELDSSKLSESRFIVTLQFSVVTVKMRFHKFGKKQEKSV